jgi:hypothetical protein
MVELALVAPLLVMLLTGIIILGVGIFYQQQLTNAAREAARYASIHSATAQCPTVSKLAPVAPPDTYAPCDTPANSWPFMTAAGRDLIFGLPATDVNIAACWSGYWYDGNYDAPPPGDYQISTEVIPIPSTFQQCTIDGADPTTDPDDIGCNSGLAATTVDEASSVSEGGAEGRIVANTVTAYACYLWSPPLAGFLLIPQTVTLRAVITEPIERQQ